MLCETRCSVVAKRGWSFWNLDVRSGTICKRGLRFKMHEAFVSVLVFCITPGSWGRLLQKQVREKDAVRLPITSAASRPCCSMLCWRTCGVGRGHGVAQHSGHGVGGPPPLPEGTSALFSSTE